MFDQVDKDEPVNFNFVDKSGSYIELVFQEEEPPTGWNIIPIVKPCKVCLSG